MSDHVEQVERARLRAIVEADEPVRWALHHTGLVLQASDAIRD